MCQVLKNRALVWDILKWFECNHHIDWLKELRIDRRVIIGRVCNRRATRRGLNFNFLRDLRRRRIERLLLGKGHLKLALPGIRTSEKILVVRPC